MSQAAMATNSNTPGDRSDMTSPTWSGSESESPSSSSDGLYKDGCEEDITSKVDPYGFERPEDFDYETYEQFMSTYLSILARRASRWKGYGAEKKPMQRSRKLKRFCRKGIPGDLRAEVWFQASKAYKRRDADPDKYQRLRSQTTDPEVTEAILLDIHRTFPENVFFCHQGDPKSLRKPLQNVLEAISINNPHIGYCQGMNFLAGLLLLVVKSEDKAFWLMDTMIQVILPDYYAADMIAVRAEQELLGDIVKWKLPALHAHLEELGVQWCLVGMKWFICLFADVMPVETVLRIWDCIFLEGSKILLRVALTLVTVNQEKFLKCSSFPDAVDLFRDLVKDPSTQDCHSFMQNIFKVTGSMPRTKLRTMREQCVRRTIQS